jgi:hypothetical protein
VDEQHLQSHSIHLPNDIKTVLRQPVVRGLTRVLRTYVNSHYIQISIRETHCRISIQVVTVMRQCDVSNTKTPKVPQHTCAVGNLVQALYTNQSRYSARIEDIPDLFGIVG